MITIHQRYRQTDRQTTCDRNTALCTKVHRAVKTGAKSITLYRQGLKEIFELSVSNVAQNYNETKHGCCYSYNTWNWNCRGDPVVHRRRATWIETDSLVHKSHRMTELLARLPPAPAVPLQVIIRNSSHGLAVSALWSRRNELLQGCRRPIF